MERGEGQDGGERGKSMMYGHNFIFDPPNTGVYPITRN